jgi:iron complex transport system substrate-binding protein
MTLLRNSITILAVLLCSSMVFPGCEAKDAQRETRAKAAEAKTEKGAPEADETTAPASDRRIVTLGGTVTEIVYALGAGNHVVAVDKTSVYPPETERKRTLDLFRKTSAESVLSHDPDLVLATDAVKPPAALEKVRAADVEVVEVDSAETIDAAKARIRSVGEVLDRTEQADTLVEALENGVEEAQKGSVACSPAPKTLFVYARGKGTVFVAGKDTSAARMIELVGGEHVPESIEGFKPLTPEAVVDVSPDAILLTTRGLRSIGGVDGLSKLPGLSESAAVKEERVVAIDDLKLLGFGPRTGEALGELQSKLCSSAGEEG